MICSLCAPTSAPCTTHRHYHVWHKLHAANPIGSNSNAQNAPAVADSITGETQAVMCVQTPDSFELRTGVQSERGKALGITGAVVSVGIVLGPTLGGFFIDALS